MAKDKRVMTERIEEWVCDHCKTATFDSFSDTERHEKQCIANKTLKVTVVDVDVNAKASSDHSWICDRCKVREFPTFEEALEHERYCIPDKNICGEVKEIPTHDEVLENETNIEAETKCYRCDVCKNAKFPTYDEALAHELQCTVIAPESSIIPQKGNTLVVSEKEIIIEDGELILPPKTPGTELTNTQEVSIPESTRVNKSESSPKKPQNDNTLMIVSEEEIVVAGRLETSDEELIKAQGASIDNTLKIVSEKEIVVTDSLKIPDVELIKTQGASGANKPEELTHSNMISQTLILKASILPQRSEQRLLILSPLIRFPQDTQHYYKISVYYSTIASIVDLIEKPEVINKRKRNVVSFQCTYCKSQWKPIWTKAAMSQDLPMCLYSHITQFCTLVPSEVKERIKKLFCQQDSGKMSFAHFCDNFCSDNGIVERIMPGGKPGLIVLPDTAWYFTNTASRRMKNDIEGIEKYSPTKEKKHKNNDGSVFQISPANVDNNTIEKEIHKQPPFVHTKVNTTTTLPKPSIKKQTMVNSDSFPIRVPNCDKQFQLLNPFNMIAVGQIMFYVLNDGDHQPGFRKVVIQCRHCSNQHKLHAIEGWHKTVYAMAYTHLLKSCRLIPRDIREGLNTSRTLKKKGKIGLKQYCNSVADHYNLLNIFSDAGKFPCVGVRYDEFSANAQKRKLQQMSSNENVKKIKRSNLNHTESKESAISDKLVLYEKNGMKQYLPPVGGVPLLSTLTSKKHSKLSIYNKLTLGNFELNEKGGLCRDQKTLVLQCQNCKLNPSLSFAVTLTKIENWYNLLKKCSDHLEKCICTPRHVQIKMDSCSQTASCTEEHITIKDYCDFLTGVYGLTNGQSEVHNEGVIWGSCKYGLSEYSSRSWELEELEELEMTLNPSQETTISKTPRHKLMLADPNSCETHDYAKDKTKLLVTSETRHVLTDYNYLFISQLVFIPVPQTHAVPRLRSRRLKHSSGASNIDESLPKSRSNSSEKNNNPIQVGASCRHCGHTKSIVAIDNFVNIRIYQLLSHVQYCTKVPENIRIKLNELKVSHKIQSRSGTLSVQEYLRKIMHEVYKMHEFQINGANCGVVLSSDDGVINKNGEAAGNEIATSLPKHSLRTVEGNLRLPFCLNDLVQPASPSIEAVFVCT